MANYARLLLCLAGLFFSNHLYAQAVVEKLQQPVWLERNDIKTSLYPGQSLESGDQITTGSQGKLLLKMPEGSLVKLGVNAKFSVRSIKEEVKTGESVFTGVWKVIKGAFRFTTAQAKKLQRRDIEVQIGTATIGIRGTDVWGKADKDKDFIVLLEGAINIARENEAITEMSQPLTIYNAPKGMPADAVVPVDQNKLQSWALETEMDDGQGVISAHGPYVVYLLSTLNLKGAQRQLDAIKSKGFAATIMTHQMGQETWYRVGVNGFVSFQDAQAFVADTGRNFNLQGAWIGNRT